MPKFLNKSNGVPGYKCTVRLLELEDTKVLECQFQANDKGRFLLDHVCDHLNLAEKDYFGLRFVDAEKQKHWLDPVKSILKQIKDVDPMLFSFRVKFYPPSPFHLKEQITRYQIYLQLRRDLLHGRLICSDADAAVLGAYVLQAELGDYSPVEHVGNYASQVKIFLKQSTEVEESIMILHQKPKDETLEETETNFLQTACNLETYGVDPHSVKDQKGVQSLIGANFRGIILLQGSRQVTNFKWNDVQKINYEGKMFIVHLILSDDPRNKKKETIGFKCPTTAACRYLWRCAIEQMLFFTSPSSSNLPRVVSGGGFFTGSKFKYTGKVEREVLEEMAQISRVEPKIQRVGSLRRKASSVPATPSTPVVNELINFQDGNYNTSPRLNFNSLENRLSYGDGDQVNVHFNADGSTILEPVVEDSEAPNKLIKKRAEDEYAENPVDVPDVVVSIDVGNVKESYSENTLFHNRDSMEHSSSESHATGNASHRSSRSQTPVPKGNVHFSAEVMQGNRGNRNKNYSVYEGDISACSKVYSCFKACLPTIILTLTSLLVVMVVAFETDTEFFALLRGAPELVFIRRQYYEPIKEHIMFTFSDIYKKFRSNQQV